MADKKKKAKKKESAPREFGPVVRRLRVPDKASADAMTAVGARCFLEDELGYHMEMDAPASEACADVLVPVSSEVLDG